MRAGSLDRIITISSKSTTTNAAGKITETFVALADVRAQVISSSLTEDFGAGGSSTSTPIVFRIRHFNDLTLDHVVSFEGRTFDIIAIREIGRRRGLDIQCREAT